MIIYYICDLNLNDSVGGVIHVLEVVKHLGLAGHQVKLFVPRLDHYLYQFKNVEIIYIPTIKVRVLYWVVFYLLLFPFLIRHFLSTPPDYIYTREMVYNFTPLIFSKLFQRPIVVEVNGVLLDELKMIDRSKIELSLVKCCQKINLNLADKIIAVSNRIKNTLVKELRLIPSKITVVPNGTNPEHFRPIPSDEAKAITGLKKNIRYIGFVGSCYPYHDIPTLIKSAQEIIKRENDLRLVIVGDGVMRGVWEKQVDAEGLAKYFIFTGYIPYPKTPFFINSFDICLSLYNRSAKVSPMKLLDYLACGKPVIGTNIYEAGDILTKFNVGLGIPPEDSEALSNAIMTLLKRPDLRGNFGMEGRKLVLERFSWHKTVSCLIEILEKRTCAASAV